MQLVVVEGEEQEDSLKKYELMLILRKKRTMENSYFVKVTMKMMNFSIDIQIDYSHVNTLRFHILLGIKLVDCESWISVSEKNNCSENCFLN